MTISSAIDERQRKEREEREEENNASANGIDIIPVSDVKEEEEKKEEKIISKHFGHFNKESVLAKPKSESTKPSTPKADEAEEAKEPEETKEESAVIAAGNEEQLEPVKTVPKKEDVPPVAQPSIGSSQPILTKKSEVPFDFDVKDSIDIKMSDIQEVKAVVKEVTPLFKKNGKKTLNDIAKSKAIS